MSTYSSSQLKAPRHAKEFGDHSPRSKNSRLSVRGYNLLHCLLSVYWGKKSTNILLLLNILFQQSTNPTTHNFNKGRACQRCKCLTENRDFMNFMNFIRVSLATIHELHHNIQEMLYTISKKQLYLEHFYRSFEHTFTLVSNFVIDWLLVKVNFYVNILLVSPLSISNEIILIHFSFLFIISSAIGIFERC